MTRHLTRREFLDAARHAAIAAPLATAGLELFGAPSLFGGTLHPKLRKAVKYGMIRINGSIEDKFSLIKSLGFKGVEFDSPNSSIDRDEAVRAQDKTGIMIHGVIDSVHWRTRLSDPRAGASKSGRKERLASTLRRKAVRNPAASRLRRGRVPGTARSWTTRPGISLVV